MDEVKFTLRLPKSLNKKVVGEAKEQRRSKNEQIIRALEERYGLTSAPQTTQQKAAEPAAA